jgi:hypothetical protein
VAGSGADIQHCRSRKATYHSWEPQAVPRTALLDAGPPIPPWTPPVVDPPKAHPLGTAPTAKPAPTPKMDPVALTMKESETVIVTTPRRLTVPAMDTSDSVRETVRACVQVAGARAGHGQRCGERTNCKKASDRTAPGAVKRMLAAEHARGRCALGNDGVWLFGPTSKVSTLRTPSTNLPRWR